MERVRTFHDDISSLMTTLFFGTGFKDVDEWGSDDVI
jgi:hypothetical protein